MDRVKLDRNHIGLQFLMLLISILGFLVLAFFSGNIIWINDFQYFVVLLSSIFAMFVGIMALLRYYTQKKDIIFLFLGIGFFVVGVWDIVQLVVDLSDFRSLFTYVPGEIYPFTSILSRGFLSMLLFLGWILGIKGKDGFKIKRKERIIFISIFAISLLFGGVVSYLVVTEILVESLWVVILGIITFMLLVFSLLGHLFRKGWEYENFDFWLIFSLSFLVLSQIFYLPLLNIEYYNMVNLSIWAKFFGYFALLVGFLNSIYELYQKELLIQKELEKKNKQLDDTKKKVEEAYMVIRKEKWDLVGKKTKKKGK